MFNGEGRAAKSGFSRRLRPDGAEADDTNSLSFDTQVSDVGGVISVLQHLQHHYRRHPEEWENPTVDSFLGAMEAILVDFQQAYADAGEDVPAPDWMFIADILRAGRVYE